MHSVHLHYKKYNVETVASIIANIAEKMKKFADGTRHLVIKFLSAVMYCSGEFELKFFFPFLNIHETFFKYQRVWWHGQ